MAENKPLSNFLLPKHEIISGDERAAMLKKFLIGSESVPKINSDDPGLEGLNVKVGDLIKITRNDQTGKNDYFRLVVEAK